VAIPKRAQVVKAKATEEPNPNSGTSGNDPQFGTCADAKAADYGPYYRGKDPEYYWYRDGDKDGIACE
jgi:micrococcal nuclease